MTNKEFIRKKLLGGAQLWRYTKTAAISYKRNNDGTVWVVTHKDLAGCKDETISFNTAVDRLCRNFKEINFMK